MIAICLAVYAFCLFLQAGVKAKKATESYKSFVEKYAAAKSEFEQKMAETAQVLFGAFVCLCVCMCGWGGGCTCV